MSDDINMKRERELAQENEKLKLEIKILSERAEDIYVLGHLSQKVGLAKNETEIIKIAVEEIAILKDLAYIAYLRELKGSILVSKDFGLTITKSNRGKRFTVTKNMESVFSEKNLFCSDDSGHDFFSLVPPMRNKNKPASVCLLPIEDHSGSREWMMFIPPATDDIYNKRYQAFLARIGEIIQAQIRSVRLKERLIRETKERKRKEKEALKSKAMFQAIFTAGGDAFVFADMNNRLIQINEAFIKMSGYTEAEALGQSASFFYETDEEYDRLIKLRSKLTVEEKRKPFEVKYRRKNGEVFLSETVESVVHDENRTPIGFKGVIRDITERKKAELELRLAKEEAEKATKLKDKFVSIVSHDLRSPLASILGFLQILEADKSSLLDSVQQKMVKLSLQSSKKLMGLIDELLDISMLHEGKITPSLRFMNPRQSALAAIDALGFTANKKGIKIVNDIPENMRLFADSKFIDQVLQNLLSNAIKFSSEGDTIRFYSPDDGSSVIAVEDEGAGVDPDMAPDLFRYDVKTSWVGTAGETGTGLGLPWSAEIIKSHGGELSVESELGKGTRFTMNLPHVKPIILVIDDNGVDRYLVIKLLEKLNISFVEATNGKEGLEALEKIKPALIILDMQMPVMDGFTALEEIRKNEETKEIPVIVTTSGKEIDTRGKAFHLGANDFIEKPLTIQELIPRVRRFIG